MNKILTLFIILIFTMLSAFNAKAQQVMIGARAGANLASVSLIPNAEQVNITSLSINPGFLAGGQVDYWFNNNWALSSQILFDQKGSQKQISNSVVNEIYNSTLVQTENYIEVPILLKLSFGSGDVRPYVFAGPSFGVSISGTEKENATTTQAGQTTTQSYSGKDIAWAGAGDISTVFGAGSSVKLNSGYILFADASYALGLTHFYQGDAFVESRDIRLAAGILFPLN